MHIVGKARLRERESKIHLSVHFIFIAEISATSLQFRGRGADIVRSVHPEAAAVNALFKL